MTECSTVKQSDLISTIVEAVAAAKDTDPLELPVLNDAIDTDALTAVFRRTETGTIEFRYAGRPVTVQADGGIEVAAGRSPDSR